MFCVVYGARAIGPAILDPEIDINLAAMLHGSQEFVWGEPVCDGDVIETVATCKEVYEKDGKGFYVFATISTNQERERTAEGIWTNIVRGV
jgi:acyl dehydratase